MTTAAAASNQAQASGPRVAKCPARGVALDEITSCSAPSRAAVEPTSRCCDDIARAIKVASQTPRPNSASTTPASSSGRPAPDRPAITASAAPAPMHSAPHQATWATPCRLTQ
ncbi:hypothetical protein WR25_25344 [Diploscapter pachys]|uniref:Uncharacterized protein n=1 Tax=Diploscapter pachys TaxID=2018661 RepID=A0A2A2M5B6_9BILA|nr:hypothetical protein WR25_25344 [Diploscapter pachys]